MLYSISLDLSFHMHTLAVTQAKFRKEGMSSCLIPAIDSFPISSFVWQIKAIGSTADIVQADLMVRSPRTY